MLGEETVLLKALEGKRGQPEQRPPHPAERGLFGKPTVVQNVQTLAAVPWILANGAEAFAAIGVADAARHDPRAGPRRRAAAASPRCRSGRRSATIVALAGGVPRGRKLKAVLVGGPSGGHPAAERARHAVRRSTPLRAAGAHVGSGSVVVADDRACVVDLARLLTRFCADEACGKTIPCRIGTRRHRRDRRAVATGRPAARPTSSCWPTCPPTSSARPCATTSAWRRFRSPSGMRYFRSELDEHILRSSCPAGVCHPIAVAAAQPAH